MLIVLVFSSIALSIAQPHNNYNAKGWEKAKTYVTEFMDDSIKPCSNFSGFMCGNFGNASDRRYQTWDELRPRQYIATMTEAIKAINMNDTNTSKYARLVRHYYDQCLKADAESPTIRAVYKLLSAALGPYPAFERPGDPAKSPLQDDMWYLLGRLQRGFGEAVIMEPSFRIAGAKGKRSGFIVIEPLRFIQQFVNVPALRNTSAHLADALNITVDGGRLEEILSQTKDFLADWKNASYTPVGPAIGTIAGNLSDNFPNITWPSYWRGLFGEDRAADRWLNGPAPYVFVLKPDVLRAVSDVFASHPLRAIKTALYTWFLSQVTDIGIPGLRYDFERNSIKNPKWSWNLNADAEMCIEYTIQQAVPAAAKVYFDHIGEDLSRWRSEFLQIASNIFSAMRLLLNSIDYMSPATKEKINKKIDAIYLNPGIPTWIDDEEKVLANSIKYDDSQPFAVNAIRRKGALFVEDMQYLSNPEHAQEDPPSTFEINSNYANNPGNLRINVFLGYNLPPYFSASYPLALKYAGTGFVIAHEIMHAFDPNNVQAGGDGSIEDLFSASEDENDPAGNLDEEEMEIYERHKNCLIRQYSSVCYENLRRCQVATKAMGDNVADIGGLKVAFAAYQFAKSMLGEEPPLPNLSQYSGDQLFYMTFRRFYCFRNAPFEFWVTADHSPSSARAGVALKNNPHFAESFNCELGSNEAPVNPCKMWGDILAPEE